MENRVGFKFTYDRRQVGARNVGAQVPADPIALGLAGKADANEIMPQARGHTAKTAADKTTAAGDEDFHDSFFGLGRAADSQWINSEGIGRLTTQLRYRHSGAPPSL